MKKLLILLTVALVAFSVSAADNTQTTQANKKPVAQMRAERIGKQLILTADQISKMTDLFALQEEQKKQFDAEMSKFEDKESPDAKKVKAKFGNIRKAQEQELQKILGNEKYEQLKAFRAEQAEKAKQLQGQPIAK